MKKLFLIVALLVSAFATKAATVTVGSDSANSYNVAFALGTNTPAIITGVTVVSTNNNVCNIQFYDSYWKTLQITNGAYHVISSYVTNCVTTWTNYYGRTNSITNVCIVDYTNTVATNNTLLTPIFTAFAGTNGQTIYTPLNLKITQGLWLSNTIAASLGTVTITYQQ